MISLKKGDKVGPWTIQSKIGEGAYGSVYSCCCNEFGGKEYAIKVATLSKKKEKNFGALLISHEVQLFRIRLQAFLRDYDEVPYFPRGKTKEFIDGESSDGKIRYLVMEKLDMSLTDYIKQNGGKCCPGDVYSIAYRILHIFVFLHKKSILYNDIKPDNFMLRKTMNGYQIVVLDFGAAEVKIKGRKTESAGNRGTPLYTSINSASGGDMYFSDDLASLGYMLSYLILGDLPWKRGKSGEEILEMKKKSPLDKQLKSYPELLEFVKEFEWNKTDSIDYSKWITKFSKLAKSNQKDMDINYLPLNRTIQATPSSSSSIKQSTPKSKSKSKSEEKEVIDLVRKKTQHKKKAKKDMKIQQIINQSQFSASQSIQMMDASSLRKRKIDRTEEPIRKQPPRACKKVNHYFYSCFSINKHHTNKLIKHVPIPYLHHIKSFQFQLQHT